MRLGIPSLGLWRRCYCEPRSEPGQLLVLLIALKTLKCLFKLLIKVCSVVLHSALFILSLFKGPNKCANTPGVLQRALGLKQRREDILAEWLRRSTQVRVERSAWVRIHSSHTFLILLTHLIDVLLLILSIKYPFYVLFLSILNLILTNNQSIQSIVNTAFCSFNFLV